MSGNNVIRDPTLKFWTKKNATSLLKYYGVNILVSLVVSFLLMIILNNFSLENNLVQSIIIFAVILMGQIYAIRTFQKWDGCKFEN
jgi:membrane protein YdbS with pleckstrin-like domain